jgi:hypothetical protein
MDFDKDKFYKAIDFDDHFNGRTREAYWKYFVEKCDQNIKTLYHEGAVLYPEKEGLHQYVRFSIDKFLGHLEKGNKSADNMGASKISPIDREWKKKPASTWGYNDDVKFK